MVEVGWTLRDVNEFRPRQHPDNMANHQCIDGGDRPDYAGVGDEVVAPKVGGWFYGLHGASRLHCAGRHE